MHVATSGTMWLGSGLEKALQTVQPSSVHIIFNHADSNVNKEKKKVLSTPVGVLHHSEEPASPKITSQSV